MALKMNINIKIFMFENKNLGYPKNFLDKNKNPNSIKIKTPVTRIEKSHAVKNPRSKIL